MNDLEHALRDALDARATAVTTDPAAYGAVVRRRERRRLRRWTTLAVAGAAATAAVTGVVVLRPAPRADDAARQPLAPPPRVMAAVVDGRLVFSDPATGTPHRGFGGGPATYDITSVTASDGRFYTGATRTTRAGACWSLLNRFTADVKARSISTTDVAGANPLRGHITGVTVSPDGRSLAYAVKVAHPDGQCSARQEVRVRDLATGAERTWTRDPEATISTPVVTTPRWAPDNRHLVLGGGFAVLDTAAPATTYGLDDQDQVSIGRDRCEVSARVYHPRTGTELVGTKCGFEHPELEGLYELGPDRRKTARLLFQSGGGENRVHAVSFDASGDHALVLIGDIAGNALFRWDRDAGLRLVSARGDGVEQVAW